VIYRINAKFPDTEAAQKAARRINSIKNDIYEVRLSYVVERNADQMVYGRDNTATMPRRFAENNYGDNMFRGIDEVHYRELPEECYMTVFCNDSTTDKVSEVVINSGGYDISVEEEKLL